MRCLVVRRRGCGLDLHQILGCLNVTLRLRLKRSDPPESQVQRLARRVDLPKQHKATLPVVRLCPKVPVQPGSRHLQLSPLEPRIRRI